MIKSRAAVARGPGQPLSIEEVDLTNPTACPWGQKAFSAYLGEDRDAWREYDASELLAAHGSDRPILIDQGDADDFLEEQLLPGAEPLNQ